MSERWQPGDQITLRYTGIHDGKVRDRPGLMHGFAHYVVEDRDDLLALWMPAGAERRFIDLADRSQTVEPVVWKLDTVRLMFPGKAYGIFMFWTAGSGAWWNEAAAEPQVGFFRRNYDRPPGTFLGWYVNLEAPFVRTAIGVDTSDNSLDVVVAPEFAWRWKDEDQTQHWEDMGVFTRADTESFYAAGREVIADVEARRFPFDGSYLDYRPDPQWGIPQFHTDWDRVSGYDITHTTGRRLAGIDHPR
jgi:hypothetical protein